MSNFEYFVIPMPLNSDGNGPEMDEEKVHRIEWQIWDENFQLIAEYTSKEEAEYECSKLNQFI